MKDYSLFLSYAGIDAEGNNWFQRFYKDLELEAKRLFKAGVFFSPTGIKAGEEWPPALVAALQKCRAFICLYSRNYFASENCGKEFEVFRRRVEAYARTLPDGAEKPRLIVPVLWEPQNKIEEMMPAALKALHLQYKQQSFGDAYAKNGLYVLLKTGRRGEYQKFVVALSEHLDHELGTRGHRPGPLPSAPLYEEVPSAFHAQPAPPPAAPGEAGDAPWPPLPDTVPLPEGGGLDHTWFVYVTGRKSEFMKIRKRLDAYGDDHREWKPYLPPPGGRKVQAIVSSVMAEKNMVQDTLYLSKKFVEHLRLAETQNTPVVIIVDPWSVMAAPYRAALSQYDAVRLINCGAVVVWNEQDEETRNERKHLLPQVEATFSRGLEFGEASFPVSVRNEEELREKVRAAIALAQERLNKRARPLRPEPPGEDSPFPTI